MVDVIIKDGPRKNCQKCGGEYPASEIQTKSVTVKKWNTRTQQIQLCRNCWPTVGENF